MTLATRIGVMRDGRIEQVGEPREIYERPNSRFVADFIGSVNLFGGRVDVAAPDALRILTPQGPLLVRPVGGLTRGQQVTVAVRPEKISLSREEARGDNVLSATVVEHAYMGDVTIYKLRLADGTEIRASEANQTPEDAPLPWEAQVWLSFPRAAGQVLTA